MLLGVEALQGVLHPALEGEGGSHRVDHEDPWGQEVLLEGTQACPLEVLALAQDSQERVLAKGDHVAGLVEANLLAFLLVDHLGCSVLSLEFLAYRFLSASGLASTLNCCLDCSEVAPHHELCLHSHWHVPHHSPWNEGPRHLRRHQPQGRRQICPLNQTRAQISANLPSSDVLPTYRHLGWMSGWGCVQRLEISADGSCLSVPRAGPCCGGVNTLKGD